MSLHDRGSVLTERRFCEDSVASLSLLSIVLMGGSLSVLKKVDSGMMLPAHNETTYSKMDTWLTISEKEWVGSV